MIELLAQKIATQLSPALPYLKGPTAIVAKEAAAKAAGGKIGEAAWNRAASLWKKLWPEVEKEPEVAKTIQEIAQKLDDPRAEIILSWQLEKILKAMSPEKLNEVQCIIGESKNDIRITTATNGAIAIGGKATGNVMFAGGHETKQ